MKYLFLFLISFNLCAQDDAGIPEYAGYITTQYASQTTIQITDVQKRKIQIKQAWFILKRYECFAENKKLTRLMRRTYGQKSASL